RYTIQNNGQARLQTRFASEWNFNLLGGGGNDQAYYRIQGRNEAATLNVAPRFIEGGQSPSNVILSAASQDLGNVILSAAKDLEGKDPEHISNLHPYENSLFESTGEMAQVHELHIGNNWLRQHLGFSLSEPATLWRF